MATVLEKVAFKPALDPLARYLTRPARLIQGYEQDNLRPDLFAGLTVAVIMLPQAIAFALIAELPPVMGLYAAVVGSVVGALWGCSNQSHNGPTNANSLLIAEALIGASFIPGTLEFLIAAGMMAVMVGVFQLVLGLARLGVLVNFVSHSVIVGFASGAGVLIAVKQLAPLLGVTFEGRGLWATLTGIIANLPEAHIPTAAIGLASILALFLLPRINPRLPGPLIAMIGATVAVALFGLKAEGVDVIGELPSSLPPVADLPLFNLDYIRRLSTGALAVGAIGLVQTIAMARSIATQTGQQLDSNQEFVGQGMANIAVGFLSGFATAGSFSRSAVNVQAGAKTPVAAIFSGVFVLIAMFVLGPLADSLPTAALAGVLVVIGLGLVDHVQIRRILEGTRGDAIIMVITFLGTLLLPIEFAVLIGILLSFVHYALRTSMPRVHEVLPDENFHHFVYRPEREGCPQLAIVDILGDLYFGAVNHIEEKIRRIHLENPTQLYLLIRMNHVNHCDFSGIHMLENVVKMYRESGGDVFMVRVNYRVRRFMESTDFADYLGEDNYLTDDEAIDHIFHQILDPAICIYECPVKAFRECQSLPKHNLITNIPSHKEVAQRNIRSVPARDLWKQLHNGGSAEPPVVVDVREPREYQQAHVPQAQLLPLRSLLSNSVTFPEDRDVILVCRTGRRSQRAAHALQERGFDNVRVLQGGMQAWQSADLLCAVERPGMEELSDGVMARPEKEDKGE